MIFVLEDPFWYLVSQRQHLQSLVNILADAPSRDGHSSTKILWFHMVPNWQLWCHQSYPPAAQTRQWGMSFIPDTGVKLFSFCLSLFPQFWQQSQQNTEVVFISDIGPSVGWLLPNIMRNPETSCLLGWYVSNLPFFLQMNTLSDNGWGYFLLKLW